MRKEIIADNEDSYDSFFDDAILEIANEIENDALISPDSQKTGTPQKEGEKIPDSSQHFSFLKSIQETEIHPSEKSLQIYFNQLLNKSNFSRPTKDNNRNYHSLTIIETTTISNEISEHPILTLEDLFEDSKPNYDSKMSKSSNTESRSIDDRNNDHTEIDNSKTISTINIPEVITTNINQQLKKYERDIYRNLMKMQKR